MERRADRRRQRNAPAVESLEGRQLLSQARSPLAEIAAQARQNAQPAPQSPSPVTTRVAIATDQPRYEPGQPVRIVLTQAVVGRSPVNTGSRPSPEVIVSQGGRELWRHGAAPADHRLVTMRPGESREASVTWDGRARDGSVVTGPVEIRAWVDQVESAPRVVQIGPGSPTRPSPSAPGPLRPDGPPDATDRHRQPREQQGRQMAEARLRAYQRLSRQIPRSTPAPSPGRPGRSS